MVIHLVNEKILCFHISFRWRVGRSKRNWNDAVLNQERPDSKFRRRPKADPSSSAQKWRKRRRRRRRRRNNAFGLGLWHQWSSDWFSFTSPEISTWLLVPKSPLLSPASAAVFSLSSSTIPKPPHTGFCIWILIWTHLFRFCIAVAEGYWLKQSSISPYAGFYRNFKLISFKLFI